MLVLGPLVGKDVRGHVANLGVWGWMGGCVRVNRLMATAASKMVPRGAHLRIHSFFPPTPAPRSGDHGRRDWMSFLR